MIVRDIPNMSSPLQSSSTMRLDLNRTLKQVPNIFIYYDDLSNSKYYIRTSDLIGSMPSGSSGVVFVAR